MLDFLKKYWRLSSLILLLLLLASMFLFPAYSRILSITLLSLSISSAVVFTIYRHWQVYRQGECTREKMLRNIFFDLLGLALTMGAALYVGRYAGGYFGLKAGLWAWIVAGSVGGFGAAWVVRSVWGRTTNPLKFNGT